MENMSFYCTSDDTWDWGNFSSYFQAKSLNTKKGFSEDISYVVYGDNFQTNEERVKFDKGIDVTYTTKKNYTSGGMHFGTTIYRHFNITDEYVKDINKNAQMFKQKLLSSYMHILNDISLTIIKCNAHSANQRLRIEYIVTKKCVMSNSSFLFLEGNKGWEASTFNSYGMTDFTDYWQQYAFGEALVECLNSKNPSTKFRLSAPNYSLNVSIVSAPVSSLNNLKEW